jgi:ArsR family transcriptional regulator, arsenate/arsenite/antimonite-responsive transcriptional repressor
MTEIPMGPDREPGVRCCIALPPEALDDDALARVSADLELLAHPIRLRLLTTLAGLAEPACVCDLEGTVPVKQPTVSHHLKLLRSAGLVEAERRGPWTYYSVREGALQALRDRVAEGIEALTPKSDNPPFREPSR